MSHYLRNKKVFILILLVTMPLLLPGCVLPTDSDTSPTATATATATAAFTATATATELARETTISWTYPTSVLQGEFFDVNVQVSGNLAEVPTGILRISGDDDCEVLELDSTGSGSCQVAFQAARPNARLDVDYIAGNYPNASESAMVLVQADSTTVIQSIGPTTTKVGEFFRTHVKVDGPGFAPTGTVTISGGGKNCTYSFDLAQYDQDAADSSDGTGADGRGYNGYCDIAIDSAGTFTITASFESDSGRNQGAYFPSSDTETHEVTAPIAVPTPTSTPEIPQ